MAKLSHQDSTLEMTIKKAHSYPKTNQPTNKIATKITSNNLPSKQPRWSGTSLFQRIIKNFKKQLHILETRFSHNNLVYTIKTINVKIVALSN